MRAARGSPLPRLPLPWKSVGSDTGERGMRSEEHTSELQSHSDIVCRPLLEKKKPRNRPKLVTCSVTVAPRTVLSAWRGISLQKYDATPAADTHNRHGQNASNHEHRMRSNPD